MTGVCLYWFWKIRLMLLDPIKEMRAETGKASFATFQTLPFSQPCCPTGWWSCTLAKKSGSFNFREADACAKTLASKYYSADIHRGAATLPPFVTEAWGSKLATLPATAADRTSPWRCRPIDPHIIVLDTEETCRHEPARRHAKS